MRRRLRTVAAALTALALVCGACGGGGGGEAGGDGGEQSSAQMAPVDQTIEIDMVDVAFEPEEISVPAGATVRFRFHNEGRMVHDATFGDQAAQKAVADGKKKREGVVLNPNQSKDYVRTFTQPGTLLIGCHQPGHYEQGMRARITIA